MAAAQVLEGDIVILVDNSPSAMIVPTSIFDIVEEADDYYFPPITGTYLRLTRFIISILTYIMTPTFLLLMENPQWVPESFRFIMLQEESNIPLIAQFLILELAIDGLKLAAVNTPNMLSTPLSVMAALVLGEFSVNSGWFNSEVMLYMAFVAIANYTQQNYELGYALKFMRIINLILTAMFNLYGYIAAVLFFVSGFVVTVLPYARLCFCTCACLYARLCSFSALVLLLRTAPVFLLSRCAASVCRMGLMHHSYQPLPSCSATFCALPCLWLLFLG